MEEELKLFNISQHAMERYAQRVAGKEEDFEVGRYVSAHKNEITERISKLIKYSDLLLYEGHQPNHGFVQIYFKELWVIFVANKNNTVVTLYKIDLGDEEVTKLFVSKCIARINLANEEADKITKEVNRKRDEYQMSIWEYEEQIKTLKKQIKGLESAINSYKTLIHNINIEEELAKKKVYEEVELLVMKKKF